MSEPSKNPPPFRLVISGQCLAQLKQILDQAGAAGRFAEFAQAAEAIHHRLRWIPLDFGEPLCDFQHLDLVEFVGTVRPIVVTYSVDETRKIVYVTIPFKLLPNSGLEPPAPPA
jgi:hypothetical protein